MIGTQLLAPSGFLNLEQQCVYYFLDNNATTGLVSLVHFCLPDKETPPVSSNVAKPKPSKKRRAQPRAIFVRMSRSDFEAGLLKRKIIISKVQSELPPWFEGVTAEHLLTADDQNKKLKTSHKERIARRVEAIQPAIDKVNEVFAADDPIAMLGKLARSCRPAINESRYAFWFFTFLAFGRKPLVLHYATALMGRWSRLTTPSDVRFGSPNRARGANYGSNPDSEMVEKIMKAYRTVAKPGVSAKKIYRLAITKTFGCLEREINGKKVFYHPAGGHFPTNRQFWYRVNKEIGAQTTRRIRIGPRNERTKHAPFKGSFSADVANLMERTELDAYVMKEVPRALTSDADLKPLTVVRIICARSRLFTGIGFSHGAERASAYRMAKFVQAVDKVWLCSLFGITIRHEEWPSIGASPNEVQDRGPGVTSGAFSSDATFLPVIMEGTPSRSPQSKALIEASNPRSAKLDDTVHFMRSDKNVLQLCVQEIYALILANKSTNIVELVPTELLAQIEVPTPVNLWVTLDARMRNDAVPMSRDEAIVAFLTPVTAKLTRRGVELLGRVFGSADLDASGLRAKISGNQSIAIQAYVLEACVRHIWAYTSGRIIQVDMMAPYVAGDREFYVSLSELQERAKQVTEKKRGFQEHKDASEAEMGRRYEEQTGKNWRSSKRKPGRPKTGRSDAVSESRQTRELMKGGSK